MISSTCAIRSSFLIFILLLALLGRPEAFLCAPWTTTSSALRTDVPNTVANLFSNRRRRDEEAEEQMRIQREILARRKDPLAKAAQQAKIEKRRQVAADKLKETLWAQNTEAGVDPLQAWKNAKSSGKVKDLGYEEVTPEMKRSILGFSLPIVQSPIDLPGYDNGQRFDLRLPYAERGFIESVYFFHISRTYPQMKCSKLHTLSACNAFSPHLLLLAGYIDEEADVMGKIMKFFAGKKGETEAGKK